MPWAVWVVAGLLVAMAIPRIAYWVAYFTMIFTYLATYSLPRLVASAFSPSRSEFSGPIAVSHVVRFDGTIATARECLWALFGWTGLVWLAAIVVLGAWIAMRRRAGASSRAAINLLVLIVGWPICFWFATTVR